MPEEKYDPQEQRRRAIEAAPPQTSDAQIVREENARRFRAESERLQAERAEQERYQRERAERHAALARQEDDAIRAKIFMRVLQAEEARAKAQAEVPPVPHSSSYRNEQLEQEQAAGRRALLKHAGRSEPAAKEGVPGFKP